mmetsp:Transcript_47717/g.119356  ORF Transcript_47717/g.119356 Transcript_47717/m.119356 type:complete len:141 (-) Transcript_47717:761-1183(-)
MRIVCWREREREFSVRLAGCFWYRVLTVFPLTVFPLYLSVGTSSVVSQSMSGSMCLCLSLFDCRAAAEMHTRERAAGWTHTDTHQWFSLRPHDRSALLLLLDSGPPPPVSPVGISPCQVLVLLGCCVVREMPTEGLCASE